MVLNFLGDPGVRRAGPRCPAGSPRAFHPGLAAVTVVRGATGRGDLHGEIGADNLLYLKPELARSMGVLGLLVTVTTAPRGSCLARQCTGLLAAKVGGRAVGCQAFGVTVPFGPEGGQCACAFRAWAARDGIALPRCAARQDRSRPG